MTAPGNRDRSRGPGGRIGLVLREPLPWHQTVQIAQAAEETGFDALFVPESSSREAFATLAGFAGATSRIRLGSGVVTVHARSPATTAMAAGTVQDLSGGRLILGIGSGTSPEIRGGSRRPGGLALIRRYVQVVRRILAGESASEETFGTIRFRLSLPLPSAPPIWLGALGDRMLELAGEVADGVILNWCTPQRVAEARGPITAGAERAGRDPSAVQVSVYVRACLGIDEAVALDALREATMQYAAIPHYFRQMEAMGLGEPAALAAKAGAEGDPSHVPEDLVRALTVTGGREEAMRRFEAFREAGADLVLCYPVAAKEPFSSILGTALAAAPSTAVEH